METKARHIAIILDGNRRYAKKLLKEPWKGHDFGADKVEKLLNWCKELKVSELTLYLFSMQNFNRDKKEIDYFMDLFCRFFEKKETKDKIHHNKVKITFIGRTYLLPHKVQEIINKVQEESKDYTGSQVNFAMAYGGREEIVDGVNKILKEGKVREVDEKKISEYLQLQSQPDLIIRTGGERRTSNFLIWQSWYSEWFFVDKYWPEFEKEDLIKVLEEFNQRERRFGK